MNAAGAVAMVFLGGGLGSVMRYGLARWALATGREALWGTLAANVLACALLGYLLARSDGEWLAQPPARLLLAVGLCGGFSTFSTFSLEALSLLQAGRTGSAIAYVVASIVLGVGAIALAGWWWRGA